MNKIAERKTSCYSLTMQDTLAVLHFHGDIYELGINLKLKEELLHLIRELNESPAVHALLVLNNPGVLGEEEYIRFMTRAAEAATHSGHASEHRDLEKLNNTVAQFLREIMGFRKLVLIGYEGGVAAPLFGVALASDYRFGCEGMTLCPSHLRLGAAPGNGLGFFLPRMVGPVAARDLLMNEEPTGAAELHRLGLLDVCLPKEGFRDECIRRAQELAAKPLSSIMGVKAVLNTFESEFLAFLKRENKAIDAAMIRMAGPED